jgi:hypothetical protein
MLMLRLCGLLMLAALPAFAAAPPAGRCDLYGDPLPRGAIARMGTVRWRAREGANHMVFVADGKYLAASSVSSVSVFDVRTGRMAQSIRDNHTPTRTGFSGPLTFTPDGRRLLSTNAVDGKGAVLFPLLKPCLLL